MNKKEFLGLLAIDIAMWLGEFYIPMSTPIAMFFLAFLLFFSGALMISFFRMLDD